MLVRKMVAVFLMKYTNVYTCYEISIYVNGILNMLMIMVNDDDTFRITNHKHDVKN